MPDLDRSRLARLLAAEQAEYTERHPRSRELFEQGTNLFGRVPMTWMNKWSGGFPLYLDQRPGQPDHRRRRPHLRRLRARRHRRDGRALARGPRSTPSSAGSASSGGITTMLPSEDAQWVGAELTRRFGLPLWSLHAHRHRRQPVGRAAGPAGHRAPEDPRLRVLLPRLGRRGVRRARSRRQGASPRRATSAPPVALDLTTRVAEFNDLEPRRARARPRRRRGDPHRAGADQHRHRPARARLPRGPARARARGTAPC